MRLKTGVKEEVVVPIAYLDVEGIRGGRAYLVVEEPTYVDPRIKRGEVALFMQAKRYRMVSTFEARPPVYRITGFEEVSVEGLVNLMLKMMPDYVVTVNLDGGYIEVTAPPAYFDTITDAEHYITEVDREIREKMGELSEMYGVEFKKSSGGLIRASVEKVSEDEY